MQDVSIGVCIYGYMDTLIFRDTLIYEILHGNEHIDVSIGVWVYGYIDTLIDRDTLVHRYIDIQRYSDIYSNTDISTSVHQYTVKL